MELVLPSTLYAASFMDAVEELREIDGMGFWEEIGSPKTVEEYLRIREDHRRGKNLPEGWIPATAFWLVDQGNVLGETHVRHTLTPHLRSVGGHIGYWVRPRERGKGYGKQILKLAVQEARKLGVQDVLVTCDETNHHSRRIIEANGGVLERAEDMGPETPKKLLFWVR